MKQPKRRFVGLDVGEVSLVDSPANEIEFLVKKAQENQMSGKNAAGETVNVTQDASEGENVAKALEHVASIVATVKSGMAPPVAESEIVETAELEKAKKGTLGNLVKAMGFTKKEDYDAQMAKLTKQFGLDANASFQNQQPPVAKGKKPFPPAAADDDDEEDDDAEPPKKEAKKSEPELSDPVDMLMAAISKSYGEVHTDKAKQLTKARIAKLKEAQEILKLMIQDVEEATMPKGNTPAGSGFGTSGIKDLEAPMEQPVIKSADELAVIIKKGIAAGIEEAMAPVKAELESIKKARPSSNSLENDGGTEAKVAKSKSFWGGVFLFLGDQPKCCS